MKLTVQWQNGYHSVTEALREAGFGVPPYEVRTYLRGLEEQSVTSGEITVVVKGDGDDVRIVSVSAQRNGRGEIRFPRVEPKPKPHQKTRVFRHPRSVRKTR